MIQLDETLDSLELSVYKPQIVTAQTDRWPFDADGVRIAETITAYADSGGFVDITVADSGLFVSGDTVEISGGTTDFAQFNGLHEITDVPDGTSIVLDHAYPGSAPSTGTKGVVSRRNDDLHILVETSSASIKLPVNAIGTDGEAECRVDVRRLLQPFLSLPFSLTNGAQDVSECTYDLDIDLTERFRDSDLTMIDGDTAQIPEDDYMVHNCLEFDSWLIHPAPVVVGSKIILRFHYDVAGLDSPQFRWGRTNDGENWQNGTAVNITDNHTSYVFEVPDYKYYRFQIFYIHADGVTQVFPLDDLMFTVYKDCTKSRWLYYKNRLGGFQTVAFHDYTSKRVSEKVGDYPTRTWIYDTLIGYPITPETGAAYGDLFTSPEVYDEAGQRVYVVQSEGYQFAENESIEITIKYEEDQAT